MHSMTVVVLLCVVAAAVAHTQYSYYPEENVEVPAEQLSPESEVHQEGALRSKRSLLLLKKKLLLGAVGLKAAKIGALGVGAFALKKNHAPSWTVEVVH
ncbi:uncharacterized protein LOC135072685 isoform X2 [Ostrinia nubilalis]|uniref:uncharacterized protein LOC135072685 isoform X2 n=1 Tax=Ostrinia nubilalis TaxID=29057 RepID=UPI0030825E83